jgi:hypothetical protein
MVRRGRAVEAWDVPVLPAMFVVSALVSGAGLVLVVASTRGESPGGALAGGALAAVVAGFVVWLMYVTWSEAPGFARPTGPLRAGPGVTLGVVGYVAPAAALALGLALPGLDLAAALAGVLMVAGQAWTKWLLILTVATLRPVTLGTLNLHRRVT